MSRFSSQPNRALVHVLHPVQCCALQFRSIRVIDSSYPCSYKYNTIQDGRYMHTYIYLGLPVSSIIRSQRRWHWHAAAPQRRYTPLVTTRPRVCRTTVVNNVGCLQLRGYFCLCVMSLNKDIYTVLLKKKDTAFLSCGLFDFLLVVY